MKKKKTEGEDCKQKKSSDWLCLKASLSRLKGEACWWVWRLQAAPQRKDPVRKHASECSDHCALRHAIPTARLRAGVGEGVVPTIGASAIP